MPEKACRMHPSGGDARRLNAGHLGGHLGSQAAMQQGPVSAASELESAESPSAR